MQGEILATQLHPWLALPAPYLSLLTGPLHSPGPGPPWPPLLGTSQCQVWAFHQLQEMPLLPGAGSLSPGKREPKVIRDPPGDLPPPPESAFLSFSLGLHRLTSRWISSSFPVFPEICPWGMRVKQEGSVPGKFILPRRSPHSVLPSHCHLGFSWLGKLSASGQAPQRMPLESIPRTQFMGRGTERRQEMNWLRTQLPEGAECLQAACSEDPVPKEERAFPVRMCSCPAISPETLAPELQTLMIRSDSELSR